MKLDKLDAKQKQQTMVLGVVCVGVFGYGAFTVLSGMAPARPAEVKLAAKPVSAPTVTPAANPVEGAEAAKESAETGVPGVPTVHASTETGAAGAVLPGQYNPDP